MTTMIDDQFLGANDFPFKQRVAEQNAVMIAITKAYNDAVTPALGTLRDQNKQAEDWAKTEIAKIQSELARMKKDNSAEYYKVIKPHADAYEAAVREAFKNNPLLKVEVNEG